jgi:hypothetical protein
MPVPNDTSIEVNLAVYTERLDRYIDGQTQLNATICNSLEKLNDELDEIKHWRTRMYGAKSALFVMGVLFTHSAIVLVSLIGIMNWFSTD